MWGATIHRRRARSLKTFQSTLPVWGATRRGHQRDQDHRISIHAPRVGSDEVKSGENFLDVISIHAPRVGSDGSENCLRPSEEAISIHAPRVGSDKSPTSRSCSTRYFNPRSPCGERRAFDYLKISRVVRFQSTLPVWGATDSGIPEVNARMISIHAPRVGSDLRASTGGGTQR